MSHSPQFDAGDVVVLLIAGSRIAIYLRALVAEANFLRGGWLGVSQRLAWLEDQAMVLARSTARSPTGSGRNGAGKTTPAELLARLYEPTALVDGVPLSDMDVAAWRNEPPVLSRTSSRSS